MSLADELQAINPLVRTSPLPGFEYVRGFGVFSSPFDSGHVLALRVFPENDFAPYISVWHRTPNGVWSIYVDGPRLEIACPRYFSSAAVLTQFSHITLKWTGPIKLIIEMDSPKLIWSISMATTPLIKVMNFISPKLPEVLWRSPIVLHAMEWLAGSLFDLGDFTLLGNTPNGHFSILMPQRMFLITSTEANLEGKDLGQPTRAKENPSIGDVRLPARAIFAVGRGYFKIQDPIEYEKTIKELRANSPLDST